MLERTLLALGWTTVAGLGLVAAARLIAHDATFELVALNSFTPWLFLPVWLVLLGAVLTRRQALGAIAAALALAHLSWVLPGSLYAAPPPDPAHRVPVRLMTANLLAVNDRPDELVCELLEADPDVLVVQELSPRWLGAFEDAGLFERYPHSIHRVRTDSFGAGLLSKWPLVDAELVDLGGVPMPRATVMVDGRPLRVYGVHPLPPRTREYTAQWERQLAWLHEELSRETWPLVAAGDFNTTSHSRWYRTLTAGRLRGAHEDRGRGSATTWPNGLFPLPAIRLDHVLLSPEVACVAIHEGRGAGSDHRPVVVDLRIGDDLRHLRHPARGVDLRSPRR